jgi:hypothetical protein
MFAISAENFLESYIFESKKFTLDLDTVQILDRTQFGNEFFVANATLFYSLKYDNFYDALGNMLNSDEVRESTGLDFTEL